MPPTHIILTIRGRKPWRRSQFDGKTNLPRRYREKTASSMTQRDILEVRSYHFGAFFIVPDQPADI